MEFDWDDGNRDKNTRHGVHDWEIEEALADRQGLLVRSVRINREERFVFLGRASTSGKYLRVVFTVRMKRGARAVRPISAIEMSAREIRRYRRSR